MNLKFDIVSFLSLLPSSCFLLDAPKKVYNSPHALERILIYAMKLFFIAPIFIPYGYASGSNEREFFKILPANFWFSEI